MEGFDPMFLVFVVAVGGFMAYKKGWFNKKDD